MAQPWESVNLWMGDHLPIGEAGERARDRCWCHKAVPKVMLAGGIETRWIAQEE